MIVKTNRIIALAAAILCCWSAFSQTHSAGIFNSPKGFGIDWCSIRSDGTYFNSFNLYLDLCGVISGRTGTPGVKFDFCHDIIVKEKTVGQTRCLIYAGPGASVGYLRDFKSETMGAMIALNGSAGAKFIFNRGLSLDIGLGAELGLDISHKDSDPNAKVVTLYKNGLIRLLYPQLKIEYSFK